MEKSKLSQQAKVKRTQHHHSSFTTHAKGTSLGRKRPTENKPKTIKKRVIGSYIWITILNINKINKINIYK